MKETPEEVQQLLKRVIDYFDKEDVAVRARQVRQWRRLKYLWNGIQRTWWSTTAHDWRIVDDFNQNSTDNDYYDKPINVFRAYLESIIAALSITIPSIKCYPDDAENELDLLTARAGDKISTLIGKHNNVSLLWLHALFIYCTEGMVACYNYTKEDYKFGEYAEAKEEDQEVEQEIKVCPNCGTDLDELRDQYDPDDNDIRIDDILRTDNFCPVCETSVENPQVVTKKMTVTRLVGVTTKPKSRQCMEVYGGLYVKVPNYAIDQEACPTLKFSYETHYSNAIERFPKLRKDSNNQGRIVPSNAYANEDAWARVSTQYFGEEPNDTCTINNWWLRPSSFNVLPEEDCKKLKKLYPDGARVVLVNDLFGEAENECLDDHWTLTKNPLADNVHFDPLGLLLVSVQEITNDLNSLIIQTIEHGIPQTFVNPQTLNLNAYEQNEVSPGALVPTLPRTGALGDGFYTAKTAALSGEVLPYAQGIQEMGQLVSGALPSLFGGQQQGGGKTAAQYSMSRAQAQQRLGTTWKMFNVWWKEIHGKVIPAYIKEVKEDEKFVQKDSQGGFINVFIRKAELQGKIGSVEIDSSEELPSTWAQRKDVVMQLLQSGNPQVMAAIGSPENLPLLREAIGLEDFFIPGNDDRDNEYEAIRLLMQSGPIPTIDPQTGQQIEAPSVPIEPELENNQIGAEICRSWLVGPAGRLAKQENPDGYRNVLLRLKQHKDAIQQQQAMMMQQQEPPKPNPAAQKLPMGASNVPQ